MANIKFLLGQLVMTRGITEWTERGFDVCPYLRRHMTGDWGDLEADDKHLNDEALHGESRIFSAYQTPQGKIWIITEADRSATTALLPDEY